MSTNSDHVCCRDRDGAGPGKVVLLRFLRGLAAVALASVAAFITGPEFLGLVPDEYDSLIVVFLAPTLLALEKYLRDGGDALR